MRARISALVATVVAATGLSVAAAPAAQAAPCEGTYTIAITGFGDGDPNSDLFKGAVSEQVAYSAELTGASARQGVDDLNKKIRDQRAACPSQHAKIVGFSEGAAVAHTWVTENWETFDNVNAVLIADPKRKAIDGRGSNGLASLPGSDWAPGPPLSGVDDFFGDVPVVTICTDDIICDLTAPSGPAGYPHNHVSNYDFNVDVYSNDGNGEWFYGEFFPR